MYTEEQKRSHIRELQGYLYQLARSDTRIPIIIPDGVYGAETAAAVRKFQELYGLPVTGEVDRPTWDSIVREYQRIVALPLELNVFPSVRYVLREGDEGALVYFVQVMLDLLGGRFADLLPVEINGRFDKKTADAVRAFQRRAQQEETGAIGAETWNALVRGFRL